MCKSMCSNTVPLDITEDEATHPPELANSMSTFWLNPWSARCPHFSMNASNAFLSLNPSLSIATRTAASLRMCSSGQSLNPSMLLMAESTISPARLADCLLAQVFSAPADTMRFVNASSVWSNAFSRKFFPSPVPCAITSSEPASL